MFGVESYTINFSSPPGDPFQPGGSGGQSNPFDPGSTTDDSEPKHPGRPGRHPHGHKDDPGLPDPISPFPDLNIFNM